MRAGVGFCFNFEIINASDPDTIPEETLVPELTVHSPEVSKPPTFSPSVITSGFIIPTSFNKFHVVIPLELKCAILVLAWFNDPTPITFVISAGLFEVPCSGPSFPIDETTVIPLAVISLIL